MPDDETLMRSYAELLDMCREIQREARLYGELAPETRTRLALAIERANAVIDQISPVFGGE